MGFYIDPKQGTKEDWLRKHGRRIAQPTAWPAASEDLPVCLVLNPGFTAAAIAYNERELERLLPEDGRPKLWFSAPRFLLLEEGFLPQHLA